EDGGVFAVDGEDADSVFTGFVHHGLAGHNENFLGGNSDVFAGADGGEGRLKSGGADDGNEDDVSAREGREFQQAVGAGMDFDAGSKTGKKFVRSGGIVDGNGFGPMLVRLFGEQFGVIAGGEANKANTIRQIFRDFDGRCSDGTGAAEENYVFHPL